MVLQPILCIRKQHWLINKTAKFNQWSIQSKFKPHFLSFEMHLHVYPILFRYCNNSCTKSFRLRPTNRKITLPRKNCFIEHAQKFPSYTGLYNGWVEAKQLIGSWITYLASRENSCIPSDYKNINSSKLCHLFLFLFILIRITHSKRCRKPRQSLKMFLNASHIRSDHTWATILLYNEKIPHPLWYKIWYTRLSKS